MGVTGLWRLIEPAGKPVPVETLENKILAVDISIWLHQMVKGYQDAKGAPLPNAHLIGLFQRLCKLLYFKVKPVFVFDGGFPDLKKETIAKRQDNKAKYNSESERIKRELAVLLTKKTAIGNLLGKQILPKVGSNAVDSSNNDDIFKLPALPQREESESESEDEQNSINSIVDVHSINIESDDFKKLSVKEKYDILMELKETRKMNSWGRLHELPKKSDSFSDFQMQRLLKRRKVQECLEETEKEMGDSGMSLNELESLLNESGIDTKIDNLSSKRIASNNTTRFLLINNVKQMLEETKNKKEVKNNSEENSVNKNSTTRDELQDDLQKAIEMSLECADVHETSACSTSRTDDSWTSFITDSDYTDSEEEDGFEQPDMSCAKAYIMQYSDLTHKAIDKIVTQKGSDKNKSIIPEVSKVLEEINKENSIIVDNIDLCCDENSDQDSNNQLMEIHNLKETNIKKPEEKFIVEDNSSKIDELDDDLQKAIQMSLECVNEPDKSYSVLKNCKKTHTVQNTNVANTMIELPVNSMNTSQLSVVCIENSTQDIITLDSSLEENVASHEKEIIETNSNTDTSDDDLEEVLEESNQLSKPAIQLTLNMGQVPDDDIFADIFLERKDSIMVSQDIQDATENNQNKNLENNELVKSVNQVKRKDQEIKATKKNENINETETDFLNTNKHSNTSAVNNDEIFCNNTAEDKILNIVNDVMTTNEIDKLPKVAISTEKLNSMVEKMQGEEQDLLQEKGRLDRIGRNISEQMTKDAQELLQIFGIPYIIAPMEAEAQCAFLENVKLTDGTITDDSDIWLFGGRTVYKNFFNQKKHVLQFLAERIEKSFNLTREQLVLLALLVGSDYTTGVTGVGPVTALEILASFPFNKKQPINENSKHTCYMQIVSGLQEFKKWVRAGKRTDNTSLKKKLKNVELTDDFPSIRVVQAYLEPNIEKSEEKFTWGDIDITVLRDYTRSKFGWSQNKLDEIIKPVLKRVAERKSQKTIQDYFKRQIVLQTLPDQISKRVKAAIEKMSSETSLEDKTAKEENTSNKELKKTTRKDNIRSTAKAGPSKAKRKKNNEESVIDDHTVRVVSHLEDGKSNIEIKIPKSDRIQEIIPQREKDKQSLLQNKLKAIEIYRKTKIDQKRKVTKRRANLPKDKAELSESSDSD